MTTEYMTLDNCHEHVGRPFHSKWIEVTQERINAFGIAIDDPDPHHIDPEWAAEHSPWGKTIAFGYLTASLTTPMLYDVFRYQMDGDPITYGYPASYGFNRMRLMAPVLADSRIRGKFTLKDICDRGEGKTVYTFDIEVQIEGQDKPAMVAEYLLMWLKESGT